MRSAGLAKNIFSLAYPYVRVQNLLAVNFTLSRKPPRADQKLVFHSGSGVEVLANADALPRVRIVHRIDQVPSIQEVNKLVNDPSFDARTRALIIGPAPALEACTADEEAKVTKGSLNSLTVHTRLSCRGMLVLADTWYPGWIATVDGRRVPITEVYGALRGIVLERGEHQVRFRYRPLSALIGAIMTFAAVFGACGLAVRDRRRFRDEARGGGANANLG
jgi:hypothetical protein